MPQNIKKVQWHPACFAALNLEFMDNKHELEILQEQPINELPLRIDVLIIKKNNKSNIRNEIGKIFQAYNLIEYKSPDDELDFDAFLKGIAQAYLYKVDSKKSDKVQLKDISLTFIRMRKPNKLFRLLREYGFVIEEKYKGIYYIKGSAFVSIQIVVTRKLNLQNHRWIKSLTKQLDRENVEQLLSMTNQLQEISDKKYADVVWEVITRLNEELIKTMREERDMCKAMAEIFKPEVDAAVEAAVAVAVAAVKDTAFNDGFNDGFNNGIDDKGIQVFKNMIKRGFSRGDAQAIAEISDELVGRALAEC